MNGTLTHIRADPTEVNAVCYRVGANESKDDFGKVVLCISLMRENKTFDQLCIYLEPRLMRELQYKLNEAFNKEIGEEKLYEPFNDEPVDS